MFNVVSKPTFTRDVPVFVPSGEGYDEQSLKVTFNLLTDDEQDKFDMVSTNDVKDFLRKVIVSLGDLVDEDGNPVTYSPEILEDLLSRVYVRLALLATYSRAQVKVLSGN